MNLLFVDQFGEIGGAQKCLLDLIAGWSDSGTLRAAVPEGGFARALRELGVSTTPISCGPYALGRKTAADVLRFCCDAPRQAALLRSIIARRQIDVIYVNGPRVLAGAALAARGGCRLIFHAHNCLTAWRDRAIVRFALARQGTAIACCEHVARSLGRPARVILNGVPDARFRVRQYPRPEWRVGIVGRIAPEKGHLQLIEAVRMLIREGLRIELVAAGAAQYAAVDYESAVRRSAADLPVRFTGWTDDVASLLADLDILAVPSKAEPGLPRVVLEAFSAGVPVVAAPTGGIPEAVHDRHTGFLARDSSAPALACALRTALTGDPGELLSIATRARAEWERHWNIDRWRQEVISVIRSSTLPDGALDPGSGQPVRAAR
ncbi:MAG TPA: glycosyltransferase family 4 protein [Bryobacteraceae bacterium]|nr:glycosyltransferase family 4 protein [Bryobacteraceae bacterium]